jgi:alkaline phosphatase D
MPVVAQVSDLHLSPRVPERQTQAELVLAGINAAKPDLSVVTGDLTDDGWERPDDLVWAKQWLDDRISTHQLVLPGNHDVGNFCNAGKGVITEHRIAQWNRIFTPQEQRELGAWWVMGINSMMIEMGGEHERTHFETIEGWLTEAKICERELVVFQHSPLFAYSPYDNIPALDYWLGPGRPRHALWKLFRECNVRLIASGHVHQTKLDTVDGTQIVWAPPASGTWVHAPGLPNPPAPEKTGFVLHHLGDDGSVRSEVVECAPMLKTVFFDPTRNAAD